MNVLEARLGKVFSDESLASLNKNLNDMELPVIPYDITLGEMENLLAYHGNMLAYLHANLETVQMAERDAEATYDSVYNEVYREINKCSADKKVATLKAIALGNSRVVAAKEEIMKVKRTKALVESRISALEMQNVSLRKIGSIKTIAISRGLE